MSAVRDLVAVGMLAFHSMGCLAIAQSDSVIVVRRGWHIDVGFAMGELAQPLSFMADEFPGARYVLFGFGDRHYLMARHRGAPLMLRALIPGAALILGTGLAAAPDTAFGRTQVIVLPLPHDAALHAQAYVWNAMTDDQQARLRSRDTEHRGPVGIPGPYDGSSFFESREKYSALHTCNTWAAEVLAQAGVPVRSGGILFAGQLWRRLRRIAPLEHLPAPQSAPAAAGG